MRAARPCRVSSSSAIRWPFFRERASLRGRHRGLRQRAPLGPQAAGIGSNGPADGAPVRQALREEQQERCRRRRGDLRGGQQAVNALRADQERRAAVGALAAPRPPGLREGAYCKGQPNPGLLGEYGLLVPQGIAYIAQRVPPPIEDAENELPGTFRLLIQRLLDQRRQMIQAWADLLDDLTAGKVVHQRISRSAHAS